MILFLSGTGNTSYVARMLSDITGEVSCFIPFSNPSSIKFDGENLLLVFPVYSWGVPPLVCEFIQRLPDTFIDDMKRHNAKVAMVCTCGDEVALAPEMLSEVLRGRGLDLAGAWSIIMPNNYVLLPGFDTDNRVVEASKLNKAPERIKHVAEKIKSSDWETDVTRGGMAWMKTKLVFPLFKRWGVFPSRWRWTPECIQCGKCSKVCPVGNIVMKGEHPRWGKNCISCVACYHHCPVHAVAYGNITNGKGQYVCPLK